MARGSGSSFAFIETAMANDSSPSSTPAIQTMPRRRRGEQYPLEMESFVPQSGYTALSYSTFDTYPISFVPRSSVGVEGLDWWRNLSSVFGNGNQNGCQNHQQNHWRAWGFVVTAFLLLVTYRSSSNGSEALAYMEEPYAQWDHNHYSTGQGAPFIVQLSTPQNKESSDISSRPNRAYARQWNLDFLLDYSNDKEFQHQAKTLWNIYKRQEERKREVDEKTITEGEKDAPVYSAVIFLSEDTIITNMDLDPLGMVPKGSVVSIGIMNPGEEAPVMVWNLKHPKFMALAKKWLEHSNLSTLLESKDASLVQQIHLDQKTIKFWNGESITSLQNTADSVCYRYYPKCDVL